MTDQQAYIPPPDDQAQLDALDAYLPLLEDLIKACAAHANAAHALGDLLAHGSALDDNGQPLTRDAAYQAQGATARAMLQAFAAMQQAAQRVGDAIAKHELKLSRARPDVVTGQRGAPKRRK
jgi:hypothetical protein